MKNNQFKALLTRTIKLSQNTKTVSIDLDSWYRIIYVYDSDLNTLGTFKLHFTDKSFSIAFSNNTEKPCSVNNYLYDNNFTYCQLKTAINLLNKTIKEITKGE